MKISYHYKAIYIPTGTVIDRQLKAGCQYGNYTLFCERNFLEIINHWNFLASRQSPICWLYVAAEAPRLGVQPILNSDCIDNLPEELQVINSVD